MPANVVKSPEDEKHWEMAKQAAAKQGRTKDWPYIMGIFKKMSENTIEQYEEAVLYIVNNLLETTSTGAVGVYPKPMGGARGEETPNQMNVGQNANAVAAAQAPPPEPVDKTPAEVFQAQTPQTKIRTKKYVGEATDFNQLLDMLFDTSQEDMTEPLKKDKPKELGIELTR